MSNATLAAQRLSELRQRAVSHLNAGMRAGSRPTSPSDALSVLHTLASSPATAADALALLHELQVHQVEVDLQQEELRNSRIELETALARQKDLYDHAPVAYLTIDSDARLLECNLAAARLLGAARDDMPGLALASLLATGSADRLRALLGRVQAGDAESGCRLDLPASGGGPRIVHATLAADTTAGRFLLALTDLGPSGPAPAAL